MSRVEISPPLQEQYTAVSPRRWNRLPALGFLLALAIGFNIFLAHSAPPADAPLNTFVIFWLISFLPYIAACVLLLLTPRPTTGRAQWIELALILVGSLVLHLLLLSIPPDLSHDSWRYLWDARVTLHGFSPYVYAPNNQLFLAWRDFLYNNSRFRNVPTIYPPGAQAVYLLSYLLAPSNLVFFKGILIVCDLVITAGTAVLLKKRGSDPALSLLYGWCPLPIIEFAIQGHVDALTTALMVLTLVAAQSTRRGSRVLTGFLLAWATLTKFYPILMLAVVLRRRDWPLLVTCGLTIVLAYIPYLILGHGQILGFFATYANQQSSDNAGSITVFLQWIRGYISFSNGLIFVLDALVVGGVTLYTWRLRLQERISMEAAMLLLIGAVFLVSTHVFPWYTTALLPWVAPLIGIPWTRRTGWRSAAIVALMIWYFCCMSILSYLPGTDWTWYYLLVYDVCLLGLAAAAWLTFRQQKQRQSRITFRG